MHVGQSQRHYLLPLATKLSDIHNGDKVHQTGKFNLLSKFV